MDGKGYFVTPSFFIKCTDKQASCCQKCIDGESDSSGCNQWSISKSIGFWLTSVGYKTPFKKKSALMLSPTGLPIYVASLN